MFKFGAVTIDVSHPRDFSQYLFDNCEEAKYVAVYDDSFRSKEEVEIFAERMNLTVCSSLEEMADMVDVAFIHTCNWDKHLDYAMPFIKKGKYVFIDKPIVGNTKDIARLEKLVADGAKILGTSALRYCYEAQETLRDMEEKGVKAIHTVTTSGVDEFNYAIHAVELICALHATTRAKTVRHIAHNEVEGHKYDSYLIKFADGTTAEYIALTTKFMKFNTSVISSNKAGASDYCFSVDNMKLYEAMLNQVVNFLAGRENILTTTDKMCDAIRIMLAGKASLLNGDVEVDIDSKMVDEVSFDGKAFWEAYGNGAGPMFVRE